MSTMQRWVIVAVTLAVAVTGGVAIGRWVWDDGDEATSAAFSASPVVAGASGSDTTAPTKPTNPKVSLGIVTDPIYGIRRSVASFSWGASTDTVGVVGYRVLTSSALSPGPWTVTSPYLGTFWSKAVAPLECNQAILFGVRAYDAAGNASASANVSYTPTKSIGGGTCV